MNTSLATKSSLPEAIEKALIHGDLKDLNPEGRIQYYKQVCDSLGLNPLTQPFAYIVLNNKLTLYAKRDCAEQLRKIHGVAVTSMNPQQIGDLFVVTVTASDRKGRTDSSTGAVNIKGLGGEALANAMMKAETKAKRRVTLSLCGLGLLDETEVETIPDAKPFVEATVSSVALPTVVPAPGPTLLQRQLEACPEIQDEVEEMRAPEYKFHTNGNLVICCPPTVVDRKTKGGKDYIFVQFDGDIEGHKVGFCYHAHLFNLLRTAKDQVSQFEWHISGNWLQIDDVLEVAGQEYRDGKPYPGEPESLEIGDEDIPF